jgi:hypothetical protein
VLIELWKEHSEATFPNGYGGKDVSGICVTNLDSNASGCIQSYMRSNSYDISLEHYQILQKSKVDLSSILKFLDGEAFQYFSRLYDICSLIIIEVGIT